MEDDRKPVPSDPGKKRITAVVGKKSADAPMTIISLVFSPKEKWDREAVVSWLKSHDKKADIDETGGSYRARQHDPDAYDTKRTILITDDPEKMADVQFGYLDTLFNDVRAALADTIRGKDTPELIAHSTVQKFVNWAAQNVRAIAEDLTGDDIDEDVIVSAMHRYSEAPLENIAQEAVNLSYRAGRANELAGFGAEMVGEGKAVVWRRSSALSNSTCDSCREADNTIIDSPDDDLSEICEGGERCQCLAWADLSGEE